PYKADNTQRLESMIRSRIAPPPAPDPCPEALRRILIKAMAPDPDVRYQSAREFADDLIAFRHDRPVRALDEDLDATRRTSPHLSDETRRTTVRQAVSPANVSPANVDDETHRTAAPVPVAAKPKPRVSGTSKKIVIAVSVAFLAYLACGGISRILLYRHGRALTRQIEAEQLTDPDQIYAKWTELSKDDPSSWMLYGTRNAVKQKLVESAEKTIAAYRNSEATPVY